MISYKNKLIQQQI